jgi:hypothetical protein
VFKAKFIIGAFAVWHDGFGTKLFCFFTTGLLCHSLVISTFSFVASRNAKYSLVTNDTNNKLYSANHDVLSNPRILQRKSDDCCSVHGSSNAKQATLFSPRIFQCKSRHTVRSTDLPMQIETRCSVHGSSNANQDKLFSMYDFQQLSSFNFFLQQAYWDIVTD